MLLNHIYDIVFPKLLRVIRGTMYDNSEIEESAYGEIAFVVKIIIMWSQESEKSL